MSDAYASGDLAAVVLAAGSGTRLRPLTLVRPKALCPVGGVPLVDAAIARARTVADAVAVNVHAGRDQMVAHLHDRRGVRLSIEEGQALGTAGALGRLRPWIAGRPALVLNADAWCQADLGPFVAEWDGVRIRLLVVGDRAFHPRARIAATLMPWSEIAGFEPVPSGLYETSWRAAHAAGALDVVGYHGDFVDCGTPRDYLRANLLAAAGAGGRIIGTGSSVTGTVDASVVGAGCRVAGHIERTVVWDGCTVGPAEHLVDAIRIDGDRTVLVR